MKDTCLFKHLVLLVAGLSLTQSLASPALALPAACDHLLKFEILEDQIRGPLEKGVRAVIKNGRLSRLWWDNFDAREVDKVWKTVPESIEGRTDWVEKLKKRAAVGDYEPEEIIVALEILRPTAGVKLYDLLVQRDDVWIGKKWKANFLQYFNKNNVSGKRNFLVRKLEFPTKVTNLDTALERLVVALADVTLEKTYPAQVFEAPLTAFVQKVFGPALTVEFLNLNYPDPWARMRAGPILQDYVNEMFADEARVKEFLIDFAEDMKTSAVNPEKLKEIEEQLTPEEKNAYRGGGPVALMAQVAREHSKWDKTRLTRKLITTSLVFRSMAIVAAYSAYLAYMKHRMIQDVGSGAAMIDPSQPHPEKYTNQELMLELMDDVNNLRFSPFVLLGEIEDPKKPGRMIAPCDPKHEIRNEMKGLLEEHSEQELKSGNAFEMKRYQWRLKIHGYMAEKSTGCLQYFIDQRIAAIQAE